MRGCGAVLTRAADGGSLTCQRGHCFDIARSGYLNLLQPQDRRSRHPGDSKEALAARRHLHDLGISRPFADALREMTQVTPNDTVLDAGCGDGFYLGTLAGEAGLTGCGIDISSHAADLAARRYPQCEWIVANADRLLPYPSASFRVVWSVTGRMNSSEFRRVLAQDGRLLVAIPSPEDLIELRGVGRDRTARAAEHFADHFQLIGQRRTTTRADLDAAAVEDVLAAIYRPMGAKPVAAMRLTFSLDLLLFTALPFSPGFRRLMRS